jgi:hypothetical protein
MQSYYYPLPQYLPPPTDNIPLSEDEVVAQAEYIPSQFIGPLLDFEGMEMSLIPQNVGDCIAGLLTNAMSPTKPFIYYKGGNQMVFTTEIEDGTENVNDKSITIVLSEYSIEDISPELGIEPLRRIDYSNPDVESVKDINSMDLYAISMTEVPQQWRNRGDGEDIANENFEDQPSYWRLRVAFLDQRTPAFIQKVRDELSRRYIIMTDPHNPELKNKFLEALILCPLMSRGLANFSTLTQKRVKPRQRRVERNRSTKVSYSKKIPANSTKILAKFIRPNIKTRKRKHRQTRKTRRGHK